MKNKNEKNNSGVSPAMRIGTLVMALLMVLGTLATALYACNG